ncbi:IPT/TIG domain-containing protein [Streptomyces sp. NPDC047718]|uniref:IPT/TIG domain-containing protein n=1 Tax=Streptomyces sp. NPDC047718 TaxID=3155479 RepID=UPI0033CB2033
MTVATAGGTNNGMSYTCVDVPTVTAVTPTSGPASGGTGVTLTGTSLDTTESGTFDGNPAPFWMVNSTTVSAVTPPGTAGAVDVVVTNPAGSVTADDAFTYVAAPGI